MAMTMRYRHLSPAARQDYTDGTTDASTTFYASMT
jgi:hypothetical protein